MRDIHDKSDRRMMDTHEIVRRTHPHWTTLLALRSMLGLKTVVYIDMSVSNGRSTLISVREAEEYLRARGDEKAAAKVQSGLGEQRVWCLAQFQDSHLVFVHSTDCRDWTP
jgi:hypothetical protein